MAFSTQTLAQGCFGKVYKVKFEGTWAAMKKVPEEVIRKRDLERECEVYYKVQHPNVVKLLADPWTEDSKWHIPLEFIFGEDLETTIFKTKSSKILLTPAVKATIITGMCEGLFHLHSKDIIHQDLKPDNIMVEHKSHRAVIIDLGLAKFFRNGLSSAANQGNEAYSAPEVLRMNGVRDKRSDVWAMGKIISEIFSRERVSPLSVSARQVEETLRDNPYCNPVSRMVVVTPSLRATMADVISDIRRAGSGSQVIARPKDVTGTQKKDTREIKPAQFQISQLQHPVPRFFNQRETSQQMIQFGNVSPSGGLNQQQAGLMSYTGPLPETGRVIQQSFNAQHVQIAQREIVVRNGKVIKYEKKVMKK